MTTEKETATEEQAPVREAFVYMLQTCDKGAHKTYVGWTFDVEARLAAHNTGKGAKATKGRLWKVIHEIRCASKQEAMSEEYKLKKSRYRRQKIQQEARKASSESK